jgi:hypothetical protein
LTTRTVEWWPSRISTMGSTCTAIAIPDLGQLAVQRRSPAASGRTGSATSRPARAPALDYPYELVRPQVWISRRRRLSGARRAHEFDRGRDRNYSGEAGRRTLRNLRSLHGHAAGDPSGAPPALPAAGPARARREKARDR